ncbi:hypothetical protein B0H14DRAFT_2608984 [Mycena olivaceomarginata]|nr:hypothetical protein B0H14DRAFT_2608984 [Mycena olivaceomarginata]
MRWSQEITTAVGGFLATSHAHGGLGWVEISWHGGGCGERCKSDVTAVTPNSGTVLEKINEHAKDGIQIHHIPLYHTGLNKTKESLNTSTRDALRVARNNNRCPNFQTFWINKGWKGNHYNRFLELTLKEVLGIACEGLSFRKGEDGAVQKIPGFIKVDNN